jgi:TRAP-type transport system periplasmic protein
MKKMAYVCTVMFIVLSMTLAISLSAFAAPRILKFASAYELNNPMTATSRWFLDELEKRTNNAYKVEKYYSGMMGKAADLPNLAKTGVVDFISSGVGYTPSLFKLSRGFELMYVTENPHAQDAALWDMYHTYAPLKNEWEKNGLVLGYAMGCGSMAVQSKEPIANLDAVKGKKFRSYAAVGKLISIWGGLPIALSYAEVSDAMSRGVVNGAFGIPYVNVYQQRWWEVAPYIIDTGIGVYALTYFAISKKTYDSFPPDVKIIVDKLREDATAYHRKWMADTVKESTAKIYKEKGIQLIAWSQEEKAKAKKMVLPTIWEEWITEVKKSDLPADEFLEIYRKLAAKYEKQYPYESPYVYYKTLK